MKSLAFAQQAQIEFIAGIALERVYEPGASLHEPGAPLRRLYVVVKGDVVDENGDVMPRTLGPPSLLFGLPVKRKLLAAQTTGATCLIVRKTHFFTIVYQCPALLCSLLEVERYEADVEATRNDERRP